MSSIVSRVVRNSVRRVSGRVAQRPARSVKGAQWFVARSFSTDAPAPTSTIKLTPEEQEQKRIEEARKNVAIAKPKLEQVVKLELFYQHDAQQITEIWKEYHRSKYCISAVIPLPTHERLWERLRQFPSFVVPIPRKQGAELFYMQVKGNFLLFTRLIEFKNKGAQSQPALIVAHYTELASQKDIVLMRGEIDPAVLLPTEAQSLVNQIQANYLDNAKFEGLVKVFHDEPEKFDVDALLNNFPVKSHIKDGEDAKPPSNKDADNVSVVQSK